MQVKEAAKALIGERGRQTVRRFGRLRWVSKTRTARKAGWSLRSHPRGWVREVILSPEIDTFTYAVDNRDELVDWLADLLERPADDVRRAIRETDKDPELHELLSKDIGWRVLWLKRSQPLAAHHLAMWVAIRLWRPALVVETGILEGLGSRLVLRALQRNDADGHAGRLVSFDVMPSAGALVPDRLRDRWTRVIESTTTGLDRHLGEARVDLFLHDSLPAPEHQRFEMAWAIDHGSALTLTTHGWSGVIGGLADEKHLRSSVFAERPREHFAGGRRVGIITQPKAPGARP